MVPVLVLLKRHGVSASLESCFNLVLDDLRLPLTKSAAKLQERAEQLLRMVQLEPDRVLPRIRIELWWHAPARANAPSPPRSPKFDTGRATTAL